MASQEGVGEALPTLLARRPHANRDIVNFTKDGSMTRCLDDDAGNALDRGDTQVLRRSCDALASFRRIWASFAAVLLVVSISAIRFHRPASRVQPSMVDAAGTKWAMQSDGRMLEYMTCGRRGGMAVYWAHGYGQSATFLPRYACALAERENLYLISISMPGFGLSDSLPLGYKRC